MLTTETIQKRLGTITCPICHQKEFLLNLRTENTDGEKSYTALCKGCRYTFPVSAENTLYRLSNPDTGFLLRGMHCPQCMMQGVELNFRCTVSVRESRHFLSCKNCGFEFNETAPAEAFE